MPHKSTQCGPPHWVPPHLGTLCCVLHACRTRLPPGAPPNVVANTETPRLLQGGKYMVLQACMHLRQKSDNWNKGEDLGQPVTARQDMGWGLAYDLRKPVICASALGIWLRGRCIPRLLTGCVIKGYLMCKVGGHCGPTPFPCMRGGCSRVVLY